MHSNPKSFMQLAGAERINVEFLYNGFKQDGNDRCYSFDARADHEPVMLCSVWVDLSLFTKYRVALQSGPRFCLQLLQAAWAGGGDHMNKFRDYHAIDADFATLLAERAAQLAVTTARKPARRPFRKPPPSSHLAHAYADQHGGWGRSPKPNPEPKRTS
jgi:hypothetical protein